jgi:hypothetical protein
VHGIGFVKNFQVRKPGLRPSDQKFLYTTTGIDIVKILDILQMKSVGNPHKTKAGMTTFFRCVPFTTKLL